MAAKSPRIPVMAMNNAIHGFLFLLTAIVVAMIGLVNGFSPVSLVGCVLFALIGVGMVYTGRSVVREMWVPGWPSVQRLVANMAIPAGFLSAPHYLLKGNLVAATAAIIILFAAIGFHIWDARTRPQTPKES